MPTTDSNSDHERFTRLLLESEPVMLRSILVMVPHRADAREILQETAVALWRQFESYDPDRPFINWAMGFSRIETRRFLAKESRRAQLTEQAREALEQEMQQHSADFDTALEMHLATCLGKLNDRPRRLVTGYYHEGHSPEILSQREGRTVEAIYKTIQRARRDLQACIERQLAKEPA
ncbi:sigma-70 family RNA polymerase sigma factor [Verrucomicrobiales bacterium]|nr:sigma-70 family RNA polymerase sigma factor [Verrucomicrobiales bacterium]